MQQLSAEDAGFVYLDGPGTPMHIGFLGIYDPATAPGGHVRFKDILRHVAGRLGRAPAFRRRIIRVPLDLDLPHWIEDPDFDLEYHVRHIALPRPADWRQLCIQVSRLHARPVDLNRPLWDVTIIEGLDAVAGLPPGCFALFAKTHLAALDPEAGDRMIEALHDREPVAGDAPTFDDWQPDSRPGITDLLVSSYFNTLRKPFQFAETLARSLPGLARRGAARVRRKTETASVPTTPSTPLDGAVGPHRVFDSVSLPLADLRRIAALVPGAIVDDAILAIVGAALHDELRRREALPDHSLLALHSGGGTPLTLPLGTEIDEPLDRLRAVAVTADRARARRDAARQDPPAVMGGFAAARAGLTARLYLRSTTDSPAAPFNTVVAPLPPEPDPAFFCAARMVHRFALAPLFEPTGLVHLAVTEPDAIAIGFTADRDRLPDPAAYAAALRAGFAALKSAADAASPPVDPAHATTAPDAGITASRKDGTDG